jgi:hypothetical protein
MIIYIYYTNLTRKHNIITDKKVSTGNITGCKNAKYIRNGPVGNKLINKYVANSGTFSFKLPE